MKKHLISVLVLFLLLSISFIGVSNQQEFVDSNTLETPTNGSLQNSAWSMFRHDPNHSGYSTSKAPNINTTLWKYEANWEIVDSPSVDNGKVYAVSDDGRIFCLSEDTGELIWDNTIMARTSSPAVVDGKVYIGSFDSKMYCLNASTGTSIWYYPTGGEIRSSPAIADGKVFIGSYDGNLYCFGGYNLPPSHPIITGQTHGKVGIKYNYTFNSTDENCNELTYSITWGDGTYTNISGPSGQETVVTHTWSKKGMYVIAAKSMDGWGAQSEWGRLDITMPYSYNIPFVYFWERLLERFPNAFPLLRFLLDFN